VGTASEIVSQGRLVGRLAELRHVEGRRLLAERLTNADGSSLLLVRDLSQDVWCALLPAAPGSLEGALQQAVEMVQAAVGSGPAEELLLAHGVEQAVLGIATVPTLRPASSGFKPGGVDLDYFSLEELPGPAGRLSTLVARAVLKSLGRRLMGFHESSAAYLVRNFLSSASRIAVEPGRVTVTLAQPPLHVILNMTGVDGRTYSLPWPPGCEILTRLGSGEED
jgi:hypothetical protein